MFSLSGIDYSLIIHFYIIRLQNSFHFNDTTLPGFRTVSDTPGTFGTVLHESYGACKENCFMIPSPLLNNVILRLCFPHPAVKSACRKQLFMRSSFGNPSFSITKIRSARRAEASRCVTITAVFPLPSVKISHTQRFLPPGRSPRSVRPAQSGHAPGTVPRNRHLLPEPSGQVDSLKLRDSISSLHCATASGFKPVRSSSGFTGAFFFGSLIVTLSCSVIWYLM